MSIFPFLGRSDLGDSSTEVLELAFHSILWSLTGISRLAKRPIKNEKGKKRRPSMPEVTLILDAQQCQVAQPLPVYLPSSSLAVQEIEQQTRYGCR